MLALIALAAVAAQPAFSRPSPYLLETSAVVRVNCSTKDGPAWGTAFYLGSGHYVTAAHVVWKSVCNIHGVPVTVDAISEEPDFAAISAAYFPRWRLIVSCDRLVAGQRYIASGYADTDREAIAQAVVEPTGITDPDDKTAEINGTVVEGMSGGPVSDLAGKVHAINIWRSSGGAPYGGVVELADTALCRR